MTELTKLLDARDRFKTEDEKQRASQILRAVEGMRIWEAKELLEKCEGVLFMTEVHYRQFSGGGETMDRKIETAHKPEACGRETDEPVAKKEPVMLGPGALLVLNVR